MSRAVLENTKPWRFTSVKNLFPGMSGALKPPLP
jgi:hypothetical protein